MIRALAFIASLTMTIPLHAQDYTGNVNPSAWIGPTVMHGAINAQARRNGVRGRSSAQEARRTCTELPTYRARLGSGNPRVQQLTKLCRQAGF